MGPVQAGKMRTFIFFTKGRRWYVTGTVSGVDFQVSLEKIAKPHKYPLGTKEVPVYW